jgi:hypothetical protein
LANVALVLLLVVLSDLSLAWHSRPTSSAAVAAVTAAKHAGML